jgi:predicted GIY-YIG superfamily endonuclease
VVTHNTEEGPIAVEVHNLKRVVMCLKSMCLKEGIGEEKFLKIIAKSKKVSTERLMKTVSRLLCHGDQDLRLIP